MNNIDLQKAAFLEYLKGKMKEKNYSYRDMSKFTGYSASEICRVLNGSRNLKLDLALKLCKSLNIPLNLLKTSYYELYKYKEERQKEIDDYNYALYHRINKLNDENKEKVIKYIDFLLNKNVLDIDKENIDYNISRSIK